MINKLILCREIGAPIGAPSLKCDPISAAISAAPSILSFGSNIVNGLFGGRSSQARQEDFSREMWEKQSSWQANQNRLQREFQAYWNKYNNNFNASEAEKAAARDYQYWLKQQNYNSPVEQARRLHEAGLSSRILGGDAAAASGSMPSMPAAGASSPSAPSVGAAPSVLGTNGNLVAGNVQNMQSLFESMSTLADAYSKYKSLPYVGDMLETQIKQLQSETEKTRSQTMYQDFLNEINDLIGSEKMSDFKLKQMERELKKMDVDIEYVSEHTVTERCEQFLKEAQRWCTNEQYEQLKIKTSYYERQLKAEIRERETRSVANVAESTASYASANASNALASYNRMLTHYMPDVYSNQAELLEAQKNGQVLKNKLDSVSFKHTVKRIEYEAEQAGLINKKLGEDIRSAKARGDWAQVQELTQVLFKLSIAFNQASSGVLNVKEYFTPAAGSKVNPTQYLSPAGLEALGLSNGLAGAAVPLIVP